MTPSGWRDANEIRRRLERGERSAVDVTREHLSRIRRLDDRLHAFLRINPRAEVEAEEADRRRRRGDPAFLTGIPVAIKDNLSTAGLETTCGSATLRGFVPVQDATAVARLREAGAVIIGKTNLDEFAMGSSTENSAFGPTRNPWDLDRVPGGSSGGSAAAVAAGLVPVALGSDTGGSVRQPAAFCGVVGLKPTYGRVSRSGLIAYGSSLDQVGILSTTIEDAAAVLQQIAGHDVADATSSETPLDDYVTACGEGVEGLRIGLPGEYFDQGLDRAVAARVRGAAEILRSHGAQILDVSLPHSRYSIPTYYLIATAEASSNLARYDGVRYGNRRDTGGGLHAMYSATRGTGFGSEVLRRIMLGTYALSAGYRDAFYGKAQRARSRLRQDFVDCFDAGVDLLLTPTTPTPAFRLNEKLDDPLAMYLSDIYTVTANLAGLPALSVPLATDDAGLPIGGQLIARDFDERALFRAAGVLQANFEPIIPPWSASSGAAHGAT